MNTTPLTDTRAYAAAVREALADLPADDVDELTEPALTAALALLGATSSAQHQPG